MSKTKKLDSKERTEKDVLEGIEDNLSRVVFAINELTEAVNLLRTNMAIENEQKRRRLP